MTDEPIRARALAAQLVNLERKYAPEATRHERRIDRAMAPIRAALGTDPKDDAQLLSVLQDAAYGPGRCRRPGRVRGRRGPGALLPEPLPAAGWDATPPNRKWLVDGRLPVGEVTLLTGPGSVSFRVAKGSVPDVA